MAVTNGDIRKVTDFSFKKFLDLINWFKGKNKDFKSEDAADNAKKLLKGVHVAKIGEEVFIMMDWDTGRLRNEAWITISSVWKKEVEKMSKSRGVESVDIKNSVLNRKQVENKLGKPVDKYVYMKNKLSETQNVIESNSVEKSIEILIEDSSIVNKTID